MEEKPLKVRNWIKKKDKKTSAWVNPRWFDRHVTWVIRSELTPVNLLNSWFRLWDQDNSIKKRNWRKPQSYFFKGKN
jgi:hypothetical protein